MVAPRLSACGRGHDNAFLGRARRLLLRHRAHDPGAAGVFRRPRPRDREPGARQGGGGGATLRPGPGLWRLPVHARRSRHRRGLQPAAQPSPRPLDGEGRAGRQACAVREAHCVECRRGGAAHRRPRRDRGADSGGLCRAAPPAVEAGARTGARRPHRPGAGDPGLGQLPAGGPRQYPQQAGDGRRRAARHRRLSAADRAPRLRGRPGARLRRHRAAPRMGGSTR